VDTKSKSLIRITVNDKKLPTHTEQCHKKTEEIIYLIWKAEQSRKQYIVGQLIKNGQFEFQYVKDVKDAINDGFTPLLCFPDINKTYTDTKLFSVFASRLPDKKRKDIQNILKKYGLEEFDEYMLLKRSGARLPIDSFEFIDPILDVDENGKRIFYIAGVRHYLDCDGDNCMESITITRGDEIVLKSESDNPYDQYAVQMQDKSRHILGYVPGYYSEGVSRMLMVDKRVTCHVYNVDKNKNCNECIKAIIKFES
jgi:hypothetical protein